MSVWRWCGLALLAGLLLGPTLAEAAAEDGRVLRIEGPEVYVDLGRSRGGQPGSEVALYRVVQVQDPKTGKKLEDRFFVTNGTIAEAGETLARLEVSPSVAALLSLGDRVSLLRAAPPTPAGTAPEPVAVATADVSAGTPLAAPTVGCPPPPPPVAALGADGQAFQQAFTSASAGDLNRREQIWQGFLHRYPDSALAVPARHELRALSTLQKQLREVRQRLEAPAGEMLARATSVATEGESIAVTLTVDDADEVGGALLHYRPAGQKNLAIARMVPMGASTFVAEIPASEVRPPSVAWQVSLQVKGDEVERPVTPSRPTSLEVMKAPSPPRPQGRSSVRLAYEYVDFYQFENADRFSHFSADFLYRILGRPSENLPGLELHSIRIGYGGYHGRGGDTQDIEAAGGDPSLDFEDVTEIIGFNFGYSELEFHFSPYVGVIARGLVGIDRLGLALGGQLRLRLGREDGTNLELGALSIGGLGESYLLQLSWDTVPRLPMSGRVEVTTHPVRQSDIGVRLLYEVRYEFTKWFELGGQVGYGLRNINHGGLSFGLTTVFNW